MSAVSPLTTHIVATDTQFAAGLVPEIRTILEKSDLSQV